ncbi:MAG: hypothetical protein ACJ0O0_04110 [Flavobacteriaceae bacterium]|nr:hypothetical protein [Flavobacteriaceae bacterium]RCL70079.1 MAG: hypothetical protein DBW76_00395 [Bacteroidota bacterium]
MSKKDIIFGITTGLISNIIGVIFTVIFLFQEISISNIFRIINESIDNNFITKLISLGAIVNLIAFFIFLKFNYVERARGVLIATFLVAILTIYINNF